MTDATEFENISFSEMRSWAALLFLHGRLLLPQTAGAILSCRLLKYATVRHQTKRSGNGAR